MEMLDWYPTAASGYTEQGVTGDDTQKLEFGNFFGADTANAIFAFSMDTADTSHNCTLIHTASSEFGRGLVQIAFPAAGQVRVDFDVETTGFGTITASSPIGVSGGRVHGLVATQYNGSFMEGRVAIWDSTNGWQVGAVSGGAGSSCRWTSNSGHLVLLNRRVAGTGTYTMGNNDIFRLLGYHGVTCDVTASADRDKFFLGGSVVDPAVSQAAFGGPINHIFDCYGDAATWNSGSFVIGSFTKSGNAFVDA